MQDVKQPVWWTRVNEDLQKAATAAQKSFNTPGVVIGFTEKEVKGRLEKSSYLIRLNNGEVGEYPKQALGGRKLPTGVKLKSNLPEPTNVVLEPNQEVFTFEVLREQIKLIPRLWLNRNISLLMHGKEIQPPASFQAWVLLPPDKKKDKALIHLLEVAVQYEGLRGLARYNDYASL